jgi:hypothetical protein
MPFNAATDAADAAPQIRTAPPLPHRAAAGKVTQHNRLRKEVDLLPLLLLH